jgi:Holliday junction resolvase RusA-like endonuclease
MTLVFSVYGVAQPKGNMRAFQGKGMKFPVLTDSNRSVKSWSQLVAQGASEAIQQLPEAERAVMAGAVRLSCVFFMPRPKKYTRPKHANVPCLTMPDWDKLSRAVGDALSKVLYRDDCQIVEAVIGKYYAGLHDAPHIDVRVEPTAGIHPFKVAPAPLPLFAGEDLCVVLR